MENAFLYCRSGITRRSRYRASEKARRKAVPAVLMGLVALLFSLVFVGCGKKESTDRDGLQKVTLQLDWYAEPAHGGFYEAILKGYYADEGLDVTIIQGGTGAVPLQAVTVGQAEFTIGRIDEAIMGIDRGLPLLLAMAYMQKDPQAIMFHASNPIESFKDLDGKSVMVEPGGSFVAWLKRYHGITFSELPVDYGIQRFLADKDFIQQCFITSQPYYAEQQGAKVKTLLLSESGYSPERVVITNKSLVTRRPEVVAGFVKASIKGWKSYAEGNPEETHKHLIELNAANNPGLNAYSHKAMIDYRIISGDGSEEESLGLINPTKLAETIATLRSLNLIETAIVVDRVIDYSILPVDVGNFTP